jgi:hypothetical protein
VLHESYSTVVRFVGTLGHQGLILVSEGDNSDYLGFSKRPASATAATMLRYPNVGTASRKGV